MKKLLVVAAAGMLSFGAVVVPAFAAEGTKDINVGYDANSIPDPDNPTNPDWSVSIPRSFNFNDSVKENAEMGVKLNSLQNGGLPAGQSVAVSVKSKNAYDLVNMRDDKLAYTLTYTAEMAKNATSQKIGDLTSVASEIKGTAKLITATTSADGTYADILTYTVASAK